MSSSLLRFRGRSGPNTELALAENGIDAGDVALDGLQTAVALQLPRGGLETKVEQLFLRLPEFVREALVLHGVERLRGEVLATDSHQRSPPSRDTNRVFMGSLCWARLS